MISQSTLVVEIRDRVGKGRRRLYYEPKGFEIKEKTSQKFRVFFFVFLTHFHKSPQAMPPWRDPMISYPSSSINIFYRGIFHHITVLVSPQPCYTTVWLCYTTVWLCQQPSTCPHVLIFGYAFMTTSAGFIKINNRIQVSSWI